jgi:hypothetical protein
MRNKAHDLRTWSFTAMEGILPDANFWINVLGPAAAVGQRNRRIGAYSRSLGIMVQQKVRLFIDVLILSEVVNTLARLEFNANFRSTYGQTGFKQFRNSPDFVPTARMIANQCRKILKWCERLDHSFSEWELPQLLAEFENGGEDFNDRLIVEISKKHSLILLTDDGDMTTGGLTILTANPRLLQSCPG